LKRSIDPAVSSLINESTDRYFKKIANSLRINWPATLEDIEKAKRRIKSSYIKQWAELKSQGQGVSDFVKVKAGNVWLEEYNLLKPSRFIDALRIRTNTFGTRRFGILSIQKSAGAISSNHSRRLRAKRDLVRIKKRFTSGSNAF
jgi:hypothetical protein